MPKPKSEKTVDRPVVYEKLEARLYVAGSEFGPITEEIAKELVGWEEESENHKFSHDYHFTDLEGKHVFCRNNSENRSFHESWSKGFSQDILKRMWADSRNGDDWTINGESIVISRTGRIHSGQHRLFGLIFACQLWRQKAQFWMEYWEEVPSMEALVVLGVSDNPQVVRTIDNVHPRTLTDVFITTGLFAGKKKSDQPKLCRMAEWAIRTMWDRTKVGNDAFAPTMTHSEASSFIDRHRKLVAAVKEIHEEDGDGAVAELIQPGTASALLYLMAACESDGEAYRNHPSASERTERKGVKLEQWETACQFWKDLISKDGPGAKKLEQVRKAMFPAGGSKSQIEWGNVFLKGGGASKKEKMLILSRAWARYKEGQRIREEDLLRGEDYEFDYADDGTLLSATLREGLDSDFGGIDYPNGSNEPTPEQEAEVEEGKAAVNASKMEAIKAAHAKRKAQRAGATMDTDDEVSVVSLFNQFKSIKEDYPGKLLLFRGSNNTYSAYEVDADALSQITGEGQTQVEGLRCATFKVKDLAKISAALRAAGHEPKLVNKEDDGRVTVADAPNVKK